MQDPVQIVWDVTAFCVARSWKASYVTHVTRTEFLVYDIELIGCFTHGARRYNRKHVAYKEESEAAEGENVYCSNSGGGDIRDVPCDNLDQEGYYRNEGKGLWKTK